MQVTMSKRPLSKEQKAYYDDPNGTTLSQAEITELIEYAKSKGLGLIPAINSPGHMDAMLVAMEKLGIKNPQATLTRSPKQPWTSKRRSDELCQSSHRQVHGLLAGKT